jgi:hypothetical protein
MSRPEVPLVILQHRITNGLCYECGARVMERNEHGVLITLTVEGRVEDGRCLYCYPNTNIVVAKDEAVGGDYDDDENGTDEQYANKRIKVEDASVVDETNNNERTTAAAAEGTSFTTTREQLKPMPVDGSGGGGGEGTVASNRKHPPPPVIATEAAAFRRNNDTNNNNTALNDEQEEPEATATAQDEKSLESLHSSFIVRYDDEIAACCGGELDDDMDLSDYETAFLENENRKRAGPAQAQTFQDVVRRQASVQQNKSSQEASLKDDGSTPQAVNVVVTQGSAQQAAAALESMFTAVSQQPVVTQEGNMQPSSAAQGSLAASASASASGVLQPPVITPGSTPKDMQPMTSPPLASSQLQLPPDSITAAVAQHTASDTTAPTSMTRNKSTPKKLFKIICDEDGVEFTGQVNRGTLDIGSGSFTNTDESNGAKLTYEGEFANDTMHGFGTLTDYKFQTVYTGFLANGACHGFGKCIWRAAKWEYEGEWKDGRRHGHGTRRQSNKPNGETYTGEFRNDMPHGYGHLKFAGNNGNTYYTGYFRKEQVRKTPEERTVRVGLYTYCVF